MVRIKFIQPTTCIRERIKTKVLKKSFLLMVCKTVLCSILGINLYNIQILSSAKYSLLSDKNRIRVNILQPLRGIIF